MRIGGGGNNPEFWADFMFDVLASSKIVLGGVFALGIAVGLIIGALL